MVVVHDRTWLLVGWWYLVYGYGKSVDPDARMLTATGVSELNELALKVSTLQKNYISIQAFAFENMTCGKLLIHSKAVILPLTSCKTINFPHAYSQR